MSNPAVKDAFLQNLTKRFGVPRKLGNSNSLFEVAEGKVRLYFRYSKKHPRNRTFFGLRKVDLQELQGHNSVICFFWDNQSEPLFVPFEEFEEIFAGLAPANDGQYKAQVYEQVDGTELYIAHAGRFNVEGYLGWPYLESRIGAVGEALPELSHAQVQTLLGGIGDAKGFDIWIPSNDRGNLDWKLTARFGFRDSLPPGLSPVKEIAQEIGVIWLRRGGELPAAFYEVEHSTSVYSGLLRFNDVHLTLPNPALRFGIVANDQRRALFARQVGRPTFRASGLDEACTFFEYRNVFDWHRRMRTAGKHPQQ
ncbi:MAG: hypothetical protein ACREQI_02480 [Candidatus Binataceae bacterium]